MINEITSLHACTCKIKAINGNDPKTFCNFTVAGARISNYFTAFD